MDIWRLIGQSYALPFQRFGDVWRVFWPAALAWVIVAIATEYLIDFAGSASFGLRQWSGLLLLVMCWFFQSLIMASGLVRWHRYLIKGASPKAARPWLLPAEWWFWWRWFLLGTAVYALLVAFVIVTVNTTDMVTAEAWKAILDALLFFAAFMLAVATIAWVLPRTFLSLPAIAVGDVENFGQISQHKVNRAACFSLLVAAIATSILPFLVGALSPAALLEPFKADESLVVPMANTLYLAVSYATDFMAVIVFATMLSLFYRERFPEGVQAASAP